MKKEAIPIALKGKKAVHITDHQPTLKHRKEITKILPKLSILNRKEEKLFLKMIKKKKIKMKKEGG